MSGTIGYRTIDKVVIRMRFEGFLDEIIIYLDVERMQR